jgi:S-DNA-T family DNA segregation ATPase FtsK/SpoIIIE
MTDYPALWRDYVMRYLELGRQRADAQAASAQAEAAFNALKQQLSGAAQPSLKLGLTRASAGALSSDIDTSAYNDLVSQFNKWRAKGAISRALDGDLRPRLAAAADRLRDEAGAEFKRRSDASDAAARSYVAVLDEFEPRFAELANHDAFVPVRGDGYKAPYARNGWVAFDSERPWATLPVDARVDVSYTVLPRDLGLAAGIAFARERIIGLLATAPGGAVRITWIDPVGRGAGAGAILRLLDLDKEILDGQVWSESDHISERLRRVTDRVSYIQQRCLQDRFATLVDYNAQAGALAEPYHVVCVVGFPRGFSEESAERLRSLVSHRTAAGVGVIIVADPAIGADVGRQGYDQESPYWTRAFTGTWGIPNVDVPSWWRSDHLCWSDGAHTVVGFDGELYKYDTEAWAARGTLQLPIRVEERAAEDAAAIVEAYARRTAASKEVAVSLDSPLGAVSDGGDATKAVAVDIGIAGRGERIQLKLGAGLAQNVLVGGLPGSGKSSFFHTFIVQAIQAYDWNELELYLLDFKQGVEFKPYASLGLPHARVIAIESEREFGVSVLRELEEELNRRAVLFRAAGTDSLDAYRQGESRLARIVLICDEFQVLLARDDTLAQEAARLLDTLVRQGRAFGIHLILGTQTLQGMAAGGLIRGTLDLIPVRIALKMGEADSRLFLSESNPAGARLSRPGEAVLNTDSGQPEGNVVFQVAWTEDQALDAAVRKVRGRADLDGFSRRPHVFDGSVDVDMDGSDAVDALSDALAMGSRGLPVVLGEAVALGASAGFVLLRQPGRNLMIVAREEESRRGLLAAALISIISGKRSETAQVTVVDCLGVDEEGGDFLEAATEDLECSFMRRSQLAHVVAGLATEVARRIENDEYRAERLVVVINGLQRARELGEEDAFDDEHPRARLGRVLRDGPDVGIHVIATADSADAASRRLGREGMSCFALRAVGRVGADASQDLLDSETAASLNPRFAFLRDTDDNRLDKIRRFLVPDAESFQRALTLVKERAGDVVHPG